MPRRAGFDKDAMEARNRAEDANFSLRCVPDVLALIRLRNVQAMERDGGLRDLLGPAVEELDEVLKMVADAIGALSTTKETKEHEGVQ